MRRKSKVVDSIGEPAPFSGIKLPTNREVGQQWKQSRLDLQTDCPNTQIKNQDVAELVI